MIDPTVPMIGRQLMGMFFGAATAKAVQAKNLALVEQEASRINVLQAEMQNWDDISFDITSRIIDKRFKSSQDFIQSRGAVGGPLIPRTAVKDEELRFAYVAKQQMLKSQMRYNSAVSQHNKRLADMKAKASFHLSDLKKIM